MFQAQCAAARQPRRRFVPEDDRDHTGQTCVRHELLDSPVHGRERVLTDLAGSSLARTNRGPGCRSSSAVNALRSQPRTHGGDDRKAY